MVNIYLCKAEWTKYRVGNEDFGLSNMTVRKRTKLSVKYMVVTVGYCLGSYRDYNWEELFHLSM